MLKEAYKVFGRSTFFKSVMWLAGGTAIAQALSILLAPVYTRLYAPESYGVLAVFTAILGFMNPISTLTYATTIPLAEEEQLAENLVKLCLLITTLIGVVLGVVVCFPPAFLAERLALRQVGPYVWFLPLSFMGVGWYSALSGWAIRHKHFKLIARTKVTQSLLSSAVKLGFGLGGIQILGLLLSLLTSSFVGNGSLLRVFKRNATGTLCRFSLTDLRYAAKRYYHFPLYRAFSRLILSGGKRLPVIFMASFFGAKAVGYYGFANAMIYMPWNLVGASIAKVYYAEIAMHGRDRPDKILDLSFSVIKKMTLVSVVPLGVLLFLGPWLFSTVFGERWMLAGSYARALSVMMVSGFVCVPIMNCLNVLEKQRTQIVLNVIQVVLVLCVFGGCRWLQASALTTVTIYSLCNSGYFVFMIVVALSAVYREKLRLQQ